jgi:hypothetical protein
VLFEQIVWWAGRQEEILGGALVGETKENRILLFLSQSIVSYRNDAIFTSSIKTIQKD